MDVGRVCREEAAREKAGSGVRCYIHMRRAGGVARAGRGQYNHTFPNRYSVTQHARIGRHGS